MTRRAKVNKEEFLRLHNEGRSITQLADRFKITPRHANRVRRELGVAQHRPEATRRMDTEWVAKVNQYLDDGLSIKEVARTLGCNEKTVAWHFPGRGWDRTTIATYGKAVRDFNAELRKRGIKP